MEKELINALDSVVWYNCHYEELFKIKEEIKKEKNITYSYCTTDNQFQVIYMMLVVLFGDYGTSPRSGWLYMENKEKILNFIDLITKRAREADELGD